MRITAEAKEETRERILQAAQRLFRKQGFDKVTTRDLARGAGIAAGTLFNYFPTKEAIALELILHALDRSLLAHEKRAVQSRSLEEDLFALLAAELRGLRELRHLLPPVLETCLGASRRGDGGNEGAEALRVRQLAAAGRFAERHGAGDAFSAVAQQLYWTLYTGLLAHWSRDDSPRQEDTLAYLHASLEMFVDWLTGSAPPRRRTP